MNAYAREWISSHRWVSGSLVFLTSFILLFLLMDAKLDLFDESIVLVDGLRALDGDLPHRDFYSVYGPGSYYILAVAFAITPDWFIAGRVYGIGIMAAIVAATFVLLCGRTRLWVALLLTGYVALWMIGDRYYLYPSIPSLLLALAGSGLLLRHLATNQAGPLFLAGCTAGAAAYFRNDTGFFQALSHVLAVAAIYLARGAPAPIVPSTLRMVAIYAAGAIAVFLPGAAVFLVAGGFEGWYHDIITYSLDHYHVQRALPFPSPVDLLLNRQSELGIYTPAIATLVGVAALVARTRGKPTAWTDPTSGPWLAALVVFTVLTAVMYGRSFVRVSIMHMILPSVPAAIIFALVVDHWVGRGRSGLVQAAAVIAVSMIPAASFAAMIHQPVLAGRTPLAQALRAAGLDLLPALPGSECPRLPAMRLAVMEPDYLRVSEFIRRYTREDERIFVGLDRHDITFANPLALYIATGRRPATHWHQFDPGLQTRAETQNKIIADLQENRVRWVIRDAAFSKVGEPNGSSVSSGIHLLDNYLVQQYRPVARTGRLEIWLKKSIHAPRDLAWDKCLNSL